MRVCSIGGRCLCSALVSHTLLFNLVHIEIVQLEDSTCLGRKIPHGAVEVAVSSLGIELNIELLVLILC